MHAYKNAGLLITGNEVLSSKTIDTNGPFIGKELRRIGLSLRASMLCGDNEKDLLACLGYLAQRCDVIFMTGGLGPTSDDLTASVVAKFFGVPQEFSDEAWANCIDAYKKLQRLTIPESNKKQAFLPRGSVILKNAVGTAVGFKTSGALNASALSVYCMPGVPHEMEPMFQQEVMPDLSMPAAPPIFMTWHVYHLGESAMQSAIDEAEQALQQKYPSTAVSYQAAPALVSYGVSLFPESDVEAESMHAYLSQNFVPALEKAFRRFVLYAGEQKIAPQLLQLPQETNESLFVTEGFCGGSISKALSSCEANGTAFKGAHVVTGCNFDELLDKHCLVEHTASLQLIEGLRPNHIEGQTAHAIALLVRSDEQERFDLLKASLERFGWTFHEANSHSRSWCFVKEFKLSPRFRHAVRQSYLANHALSALILLVLSLHA